MHMSCFVTLLILIYDYTLGNIMSANDQGIIAVTGRAHCQRQVAFFTQTFVSDNRIICYLEPCNEVAFTSIAL